MKARVLWIVTILLIISTNARALVFINEVFINPSDVDENHEFIELLGTPGMKLDGYAIAVLNGTEEKYYPSGSIPPVPDPAPEIDEFFSLDGQSLGANGILGLMVRDKYNFNYPGLLDDSARVDWGDLWNGGLDVPGRLGNDGSTTIILIRNRPGITEADPNDPNGLLWAKVILHDAELISNGMDQFGNGNLDRSYSLRYDGNSMDFTGLNTFGDLSDDLEIVDEVSYEDGQGWEYDTDGRHVDEDSTCECLPHRHVHAIDDPANFNPDSITRVDYRTKGPGWTPSCGATGEMTNDNNWQDTATEQWIRGSCVHSGSLPRQFYYDNDPNSDPNAVQPYETHVPLWLDDGNDVDYDFSTANTYEIILGRINPLAIAFIPGDVDRDGVCDGNDITKISAVFGDDDWIFSNSFWDAPEGDSNDPATQTKPWDVDGTGDNGIEASDMQWVLNFQGDITGQIVGVQYDSTTPASSGVVLNPNTDVNCTVSTSANSLSGRALSELFVNDIIEITVSGRVTDGPNTTSGEENGIMQYVHDIEVNCPNVVQVISVEPLGSFNTTRQSLQVLQGSGGDLGVDSVNGYTTSFTEGLADANELYRVKLKVIGAGSADITIWPALATKFAVSTPHGLKIGHTDTNGDPNSSVYPAAVSVTATECPDADFNGDCGVDFEDFAILGAQWMQAPGEPSADIAPEGGDNIVDEKDLELLSLQWLETAFFTADFNGDCEVDFEDFAILGSQWMDVPGVPSADIAPDGGDNIVDEYDLAVFCQQWLEGK